MRYGWVESATATAATATATRAAQAGRQHVVKAVTASFDQTAVALLTIRDGATVVWQGYVHNQAAVTFPSGIAATKGNAVSAELASGGTGVTGAVALHGETF